MRRLPYRFRQPGRREIEAGKEGLRSPLMQLHLLRLHMTAGMHLQAILCYVMAMNDKPIPAVIEAWSGLVRLGRALFAKGEEQLKRAGLPPLDWYHVLHEIDAAPKGMLRQNSVQDRTQMAQ